MSAASAGFHVVEDDLSGPGIAALLALHLAEMHQWSPPESVHALPIEALREPGVSFYAAWAGEELAACGALKQLDAHEGELKSMRAAPAWRGKGAGRAILDHLIAEARSRGLARLWLETGTTDQFVPARRLYTRAGFRECGPFADYRPDPFSVFMTRDI